MASLFCSLSATNMYLEISDMIRFCILILSTSIDLPIRSCCAGRFLRNQTTCSFRSMITCSFCVRVWERVSVAGIPEQALDPISPRPRQAGIARNVSIRKSTSRYCLRPDNPTPLFEKRLRPHHTVHRRARSWHCPFRSSVRPHVRCFDPRKDSRANRR